MAEIVTRPILGDCREVLKTLDDHSVDLIFTSPPYADSRATTYGGIRPDEYIDWFLPMFGGVVARTQARRHVYFEYQRKSG